MRDLTASVETEIGKAELSPILLAELDFSSGFVRVWNGYGTISHNGSTYTGAGTLVAIAPITESTELKAVSYSMSLTGIPSTLLATALGESYQGRAAKVWLGFMNTTGSLIADPVLALSAHMDTMEINEGAESSTITLTVETTLANLRARESRYTDQEQQRRYAGDTGLSRVAKLVDKAIFWGSGR